MAIQRTNIECSCGERTEADGSVSTVRCDCGEIYAVTVTKIATVDKR